MNSVESEKLLDIPLMVKTANALNDAVNHSNDYKDSLKDQDKAFDGLNQTNLNEAQKRAVNKAISSTNNCGAVYGRIACRQVQCKLSS